mmetsp:Transcript_76399/g.181710  ORF Transcript_76399/g.181710 Transcript_76399/m.181710 type:complete len:530 (+) Transcript_76399:83-1672(+)
MRGGWLTQSNREHCSTSIWRPVRRLTLVRRFPQGRVGSCMGIAVKHKQDDPTSARCFCGVAAVIVSFAATRLRTPLLSRMSQPAGGSSGSSAEQYALSVKQEIEKVASSPEDSSGDLKVVFVSGNEAGDLDSIVSALAVAYGFAHAGKLLSSSKDERLLVMPMVNIPRSEFRLRGDARLAFKKSSFQMDAEGAPSCYFFREEVATLVPQLEKKLGKPCGIVLADHNSLGTSLQHLFPPSAVCGIVDHHTDEGNHTEISSAARIVEAGVGSACTLAAEVLINHNVEIPADLGRLLYSAILIDVRNFDLAAKRFSEKDEAILPQLARFRPTPKKSQKEHQLWWYDELTEARADVEGLSSMDLMKLDFKDVEVAGIRVGVASIFAEMVDYVQLAGGMNQLTPQAGTFSKERKLDILILLTKASKAIPAESGEKQKGFLLFNAQSSSSGVADSLITTFSSAPADISQELLTSQLFQDQLIHEHGFGFREVPASHFQATTESTGIRAFTLRKVISRKTVLPTVVEILMKNASSL